MYIDLEFIHLQLQCRIGVYTTINFFLHITSMNFCAVCCPWNEMKILFRYNLGSVRLREDIKYYFADFVCNSFFTENVVQKGCFLVKPFLALTTTAVEYLCCILSFVLLKCWIVFSKLFSIFWLRFSVWFKWLFSSSIIKVFAEVREIVLRKRKIIWSLLPRFWGSAHKTFEK